MEERKVNNGKLEVGDMPVIPFIAGDGIGPEIWEASRKVFDKAVAKAYNGKRKIIWQEILAGQKAFDKTGTWLPEETIATIRREKIAIKGPLTTPIGGGFRSLNVTLRQTLDLFACVRPVRYFTGVPSPLKAPEKTDMVIFRENTEDVYAGIEFEEGKEETKQLISVLEKQFGVDKIRFPNTSAIGIKPIALEGTERLVRSAIEYALKGGRTSVTLVHKGNIMKFTEGGFKKWGYALAEREFAEQVFTMNQYAAIAKENGEAAAEAALKDAQAQKKLIIKDVIADNFLQQILLYPEKYDVAATMNLNGDYISDALAAQVGGIGIAPGANINYVSGHAIFEATHGTAPDVAGKNIANPCSLLLSGCMMLEYIGWDEAAALITQAIEQAFAAKVVTKDFAIQMQDAQEVGTAEFGEALINELS
jgi:isocitrate dehydrogenase